MSYDGLTCHLRKYHDEVNDNMFYCNKRFPGKTFMTAHIVSHIGTRDFKCDTCAAAFKTISQLTSHRKRHNNVFSLFCQYCGKGFRKSESQKLRDHENTHTGAKPHLCTFCDYKCASISNLIKHKKLVHKK